MSPIQLRSAQFSDYEPIARLHADNWKKNYRGMMSDDYLDHKVDTDRLLVWHDRLKDPNVKQIVTVAFAEGKLAGFCCTLLDDDPIFGSLIDNLHVCSSMQKSGIGKLLVKDAAANILAKSSSGSMYLWVYEANTNARAAYERLGGKNHETVLKESSDGSRARTCRYVWEDVQLLVQ
jgi:GNAT superfamily N-acetyltransferase